jgi:hypothetical protein
LIAGQMQEVSKTLCVLRLGRIDDKSVVGYIQEKELSSHPHGYKQEYTVNPSGKQLIDRHFFFFFFFFFFLFLP